MQSHHSFRTLPLFGSLMLAWLAAGQAHAQTCPSLQLLDQIQMVPVNDGTTMLVPVTINGVGKVMVFDTGASASPVTRALADELGLSVHPNADPNVHALYDAYGHACPDMTMAGDFKFGRQDIHDAQFKIWPNPELENTDSRLAGVLSLDQLPEYDVDVDFPSGVLKLFSPEHCDGKILYWNSSAVAVSAFDTRGRHINIVATLNEKKLDAIIDTGAANSILSADAARRYFGLTAESPGMKQSAILAKDYPVYQHRFSNLDFNGVAVIDPVIAIWPNTTDRYADKSLQNTRNRAIPMSAGVKPPQLIIGMDILSKLHMYIASREHRIYFSGTPANPPSLK